MIRGPACEIAIVEIAAMSSLGASLEATCEALRGAGCGVRAGTALEQTSARPAGVGEVPLPLGESAAGSRAEILLRSTLRQLRCLERSDSGPPPALVVGTTLGGMRHCGDAIRHEAAGELAEARTACCRMPAATVLERAAKGLAIGSFRVSLSCACASALSAIAHACALIRSGASRWAIAGGYDPISEFAYGGFSALQLVAAGPLSPFAAEREGMKLGEGCALYALRELSDAMTLGERVVGVIESIGESSDGHHLTQPHPEGRGAAAALRAACRCGAPDLLVAHATGTPGNDAAEYEAYRAAFGERLAALPVTALKSRFGHPLGAAGALELAAAIGCAERGFLPAGIGRTPDRGQFPELALLHDTARAGRPRRIAALAAGFGGANVAISVRCGTGSEAPSKVATADRSARTRVALAGVGAVSPAGRGVERLREIASTSQPVPDEVLAPLLDRARTRRIAHLPRLMLAAVRDLLDRTGMEAGELRDVPLIAATWHGALAFTEQYYRDLFRSGIDLANPMLFAESVPNIGSAHLSLGYGIQAASVSAVGSRAGGLQAIALAMARIRAGEWDRALVVAADECHPAIGDVLGPCLGERVEASSAAVAMLLTNDGAGSGATLIDVLVAPAPIAAPWTPLTSSSPVDRPLRGEGMTVRPIPELGAATPLALLLTECDRPMGASAGRFAIGCQEPGGVAWRIRASRTAVESVD